MKHSKTNLFKMRHFVFFGELGVSFYLFPQRKTLSSMAITQRYQ